MLENRFRYFRGECCVIFCLSQAGIFSGKSLEYFLRLISLSKDREIVRHPTKQILHDFAYK